MRLLFVLGSNPDLSKKEIEAAATILPFLWTVSMLRPALLELKSTETFLWEGQGIAGYLSQEAVDLRQQISSLQRRLGGTIQIIYLWQQAALRDAPTVIANMFGTIPTSGGRWKLAVRSFGSVDAERFALQVKRELKQREVGMLYLPSKSGVAGVLHEKLDLAHFDLEHPGCEISVLNEGQGLWLGITLTLQDIEEYSRRDFGIPAPDALSGMLPPKLAQALINLAVGSEPAVVYDPFCGNGRIVLEAAQMGFEAFGSDIVPEKVTASRANLTWLKESVEAEQLIWEANATAPSTTEELLAHISKNQRVVIVAEPYLGKPLRQPLTPEEGTDWLNELSELYLKFFTTWRSANIATMVIIFPSARLTNRNFCSLFDHLFDRLREIGYGTERLSTYARADALVKRDIVKVTYRT